MSNIATVPANSNEAGATMFSFGDPVAVLDGREVMDYLECWSNGKWYEPPISMHGLAKAFRSSTHHTSALYFKRNLLTKTFIPHKLLSRAQFERLSLEFLVFGNGYLERKNNIMGQALTLEPPLSKYTRRGLDPDQFWYVQGWKQEHEFKRGSVLQIMEQDINQEVYGLPEYLSALQSAFLNESATLFRRRYYLNGSHAGFILYLNDTVHEQKDIDAIRTSLKSSKGLGNFKNLFVYAPGGKKDGIQLIPISEVQAKDEFNSIKSITRDDMLAAHRIPPQLMGIVPSNAGGFGSIRDAAMIYAANELAPLQEKFQVVNDWIGEEVIRFREYELPNATGTS